MSARSSEGPVVNVIDQAKRLWRRALGQEDSAPNPTSGSFPTNPQSRRSSGLREFWKAMKGTEGLKILDLGPASQANISFITELGHKLSTADMLHSIVLAAPTEASNLEPAAVVEQFFQENLNYSDAEFDGILCWDILDFIADPLVKPVVDRLQKALKPGGIALCFFHTDSAGLQVPVYQYRIEGEETLQMTVRSTGKLHRHFNNRTIETMFHDFSSIKFYLSRDNLREVISVR